MVTAAPAASAAVSVKVIGVAGVALAGTAEKTNFAAVGAVTCVLAVHFSEGCAESVAVIVCAPWVPNRTR